MNDGVTAKNELNTAIEEENTLQLYGRIRNGAIALLIGKTAQASRTKGFGSGWDFRKKIFKLDQTRVKRIRKKKKKKKTGTGVRIFSSVTEMIGRLMVLIISKEARNVGAEIDNEIIDILDNLRPENLLTSDEYET